MRVVFLNFFVSVEDIPRVTKGIVRGLAKWVAIWSSGILLLWFIREELSEPHLFGFHTVAK